MSELERCRDRLKSLILNTCNVVGCEDCPFKWPLDVDGNKCQSDYLMSLELELEYNTLDTTEEDE